MVDYSDPEELARFLRDADALIRRANRILEAHDAVCGLFGPYGRFMHEELERMRQNTAALRALMEREPEDEQ